MTSLQHCLFLLSICASENKHTHKEDPNVHMYDKILHIY